MQNNPIDLRGNILSICLPKNKSNTKIVKDLEIQLNHLIASRALNYGPLIKVQGPLSMPAAFVLAHQIAHLFGAIAVFDPDLQKHVIAISQSPHYQIGDVLE